LGEIQIPGSGNYSIQPIYINDVIKIIFNSIIQNKYDKLILDLVGSELITFKKYVKVFSNERNVKITKINLEHAYHEAISNPRAQFGVDDLNILIGNFKGDHKRLKNISGINFSSILKLLKSSRLF